MFGDDDRHQQRQQAGKVFLRDTERALNQALRGDQRIKPWPLKSSSPNKPSRLPGNRTNEKS